MSLFLTVVSVNEATAVIRSLAVKGGEEFVPLNEALHRVLARDVRSDVDIPGFTRSVVDGYAVRAADTTGSGDAIPAILTFRGRIAMGTAVGAPIVSGDCIYIPTGGILPNGADAVVMIENTEQIGGEVLIKKPVAPSENVLLSNEDFSRGEVVLTAGRKISAQDTGVLAAAGCSEVPVVMRPKVGIISTGNELVPVTATPGMGQVRDVNSYVVGAFVQEQGGLPVHYGIVRDDRDSLSTAIKRATSECNAVLVSGGSSKDDRDIVAAVISETGDVLVHGIAIAPGKPTIIGKCSGKPVIGLPGHPASAFIILVAIVRHLFTGMTGNTAAGIRTLPATLSQNVPSSRGREDYIRVIVKNGVATPLFGKSGLLNTLVKSSGFVRVPAGSEGLETGTQVEVVLW
jgi:molybdopterin molybdotransferase